MLDRVLKTACCALLLVTAASVTAAPEAELWPRWQTHDPVSTTQVDHSAWDTLLTAYLRPQADGITRFAYTAVTADDRARLADYLRLLAATPVSGLRRDEQYAYWVNLYNALTIDVVLDHLPVESILDIGISPGLFSHGPWGAKLVEVEGEMLSLDDIEHRILRPIWADPRTHYAVNCASLGCPNLAPEAFTAGNRERLLESGAHAYVNHPRGVSVDSRGRLTASSIYDWFAADFGGNEQGVLAHLARFADAPLAASLRSADGIRAYDYDWSLNGAPR